MSEAEDAMAALRTAIEKSLVDAIRYGIEIETDYYGNGADDERYILEPAKRWAATLMDSIPSRSAVPSAVVTGEKVVRPRTIP